MAIVNVAGARTHFQLSGRGRPHCRRGAPEARGEAGRVARFRQCQPPRAGATLIGRLGLVRGSTVSFLGRARPAARWFGAVLPQSARGAAAPLCRVDRATRARRARGRWSAGQQDPPHRDRAARPARPPRPNGRGDGGSNPRAIWANFSSGWGLPSANRVVKKAQAVTLDASRWNGCSGGSSPRSGRRPCSRDEASRGRPLCRPKAAMEAACR